MEKQDLKNFMRVKTRNDITYIVTGDLAIECDGSILDLSEDYDDKLLQLNRDYDDYDIVSVYDKPAKNLVLEHDYKGELIWKRQEFEEMRIAVPYPWMWEEVEKWAFANGIGWNAIAIGWKAGWKTHLDAWDVYCENSFIIISESNKMLYGSFKIEDENNISFAEFCEKTGHEPEKWGIVWNKENKYSKEMPQQEQEIEIDGKMFSVSTIKNALKNYLK